MIYTHNYIYIYTIYNSEIIFKDCTICFELPMSLLFLPTWGLQIIMWHLQIKIGTFYITSQIYWHYAFPLICKGHYFIEHLKYILLEMLLHLELYCIINDKVCPNTSNLEFPILKYYSLYMVMHHILF